MTIAVFERPIAIVSLNKLVDDFMDNPWETRDMVVLPQDVGPFMENNPLRIPPGKFTDEDDGKPMNVGDGTSEDHLARVAWLVDNWDDDKNEPLQFISGDNSVFFENGLHRAMAMIHLGHDQAQARFDRGFKEIVEEHESFIAWKESPTLPGEFGYNVIASEDELYKLYKNEDRGLVTIVNEDNDILLKARLKGDDKFIEYHMDGERKTKKDTNLSTENLKAALHTTISPIFKELPVDYFDHLGEIDKSAVKSTDGQLYTP